MRLNEPTIVIEELTIRVCVALNGYPKRGSIIGMP